MSYPLLKSLHMSLALLTISGFMLRGYWMMTGSELLKHKATRIAPHVVDTLFLLTAVALVSALQLNVHTQPWLLAKFMGLVAYVLLGSVAIKRGRNLRIRVMAFIASLAIFAYIIGVAISKSPGSWLAVFAN